MTISVAAIDEVLALLLADAPAEEIAASLEAQARSDPSSAEVVESVTGQALRLRAELLQLRQREQELIALNRTASDLTALHEPEAVLQAIVERAAEMCAADLSWITLIDEPRGDVFVCVAEGTVTADFGQLRIPLGAGLGGVVAATGRPYSSPNVTRDPRIGHPPNTTSVLQREGITGVLGVPLKLPGRVIGVIYVADRRARSFTHHDTQLLSSLATHAAIAIENTRLLGEASSAMAELAETHDALCRQAEILARSGRLDARLIEIALAAAADADARPLLDVAQTVAEVLGGSVAVVGPDGACEAAAGPNGSEIVDVVAAEQLTGVAVAASRTTAIGDLCVVPIVVGTDRLGLIAYLPADGLRPEERTAVERASLVAGLVLTNQRLDARAEQHVRGELIADVIDARPDSTEATARRARRLGFSLDAPHAAAVIAWKDPERRRTSVAALLADHDVLVGERGQRHVALLELAEGEDMNAAGARLERLVRRGTSDTCAIGIAGPGSGVAGLASAHAQAQRCVDVLLALGSWGTVATPGDLGVFGLLLTAGGRDQADAMIELVLADVLRYDAQHSTELLKTLEAYFSANGQLSKAAALLPVHVNTLYQRLDRLTDILGDDWRARDRALQINLALRLRSLREGLHAPE